MFCAAMAVAGCSDDGSPADGGQAADLLKPDAAGPDLARPDLARVDLPSPDRGPAPDLLAPDAGPCTGTWTATHTAWGPSLHDVWASGPQDAWAAGSGGKVLRMNAKGWSTVSTSTSEMLHAVWGSGPSNVFVVGSKGAISRFDGKKWSSMKSGTTESLHGVWGSGPNDVYAVGGSYGAGLMLHYDGKTWAPVKLASKALQLNDVWVSKTGIAFAVATGGGMLRHDGNKNAVVGTALLKLSSVWGRSESDVVAVGALGVGLRYDGKKATVISVGSANTLEAVAGNGQGELMAVGLPYPVGSNSPIFHFDGKKWSKTSGWKVYVLTGVTYLDATSALAVGYSPAGVGGLKSQALVLYYLCN